MDEGIQVFSTVAYDPRTHICQVHGKTIPCSFNVSYPTETVYGPFCARCIGGFLVKNFEIVRPIRAGGERMTELQWTRGEPTQPGWYWMRVDGLRVGIIDTNAYRDMFSFRDNEFAGPITPPAEPPKPEYDFKIGDCVVRKEDTVGPKFTVKRISETGASAYCEDSGGFAQWHPVCCLVKLERSEPKPTHDFRVGDLVVRHRGGPLIRVDGFDETMQMVKVSYSVPDGLLYESIFPSNLVLIARPESGIPH